VKDPLDRIRELENHCEALENALAKITAVTFEPKQTLPAVKRRIAKILVAVPDRRQEGTRKNGRPNSFEEKRSRRPVPHGRPSCKKHIYMISSLWRRRRLHGRCL